MKVGKRFGMKCVQRILKIVHREHRASDYMWINDMQVPTTSLPKNKHNEALMVCPHLQIQHHHHGTVASTIEGKVIWGRPRKMWLDNIKDYTYLSIDHLLDSAQDNIKMTKGEESIDLPTHRLVECMVDWSGVTKCTQI